MDRDKDGRSTDRLLITSQLIIAVTSLIGLLLSVATISTDQVPLSVVLGSVLGLAYFAGIFLFVRYLRRSRDYDLRIAVTGAPSVGKTVFSILLFDQLMSQTSPGATFSAEARAAIAVHQAIRTMNADVWPRRTMKGIVDRYEGEIQYGRRARVDLEIGDSAGEHWLELADDSASSEDFLQYVVSSDAIVHVISAEALLDGYSPSVLNDLDDLRTAAQLMRRTRRDSSKLGPLLLVISKLDLVLDLREAEGILQQIEPYERFAGSNLSHLLGRQRLDVEIIDRFVSVLSEHFSSVSVLGSSAQAVLGSARLNPASSESISRWIYEAATTGPHGQRLGLIGQLGRSLAGPRRP